VVSLVIATVLYNAITEKREFDRENAPDTATAASAPAVSGSSASGGAAQ
jgi:hypothetical protein